MYHYNKLNYKSKQIYNIILKALQEHPDAELIFEKMMEPDTGNGRLCQQLGDLTLFVSEYNVIITQKIKQTED